MKRIIDIHMHVIPDADDGPDTMEEALELLRRSSEQGVTDIIATSHDSAFFGKAEQTVLKYLDLKRAAAEANIPVSLYLGAELYLDLKHMESDILPKLKDGSYPTLNGTKYVLVEFSTREREEDICACLDCLLEEGYYPVLAHAERYQNLHHETIARLKQRGILIQINLYSIEDENDFVIRGRTNQYLQMSLVDVIGSDTHRLNHRPHNHIRSKVACGLYYFCVRAILDEDGSLLDRLQSGIDQGWAFYKNTLEDERELFYYNRCRRIQSLKETSEKEIFSGGYVVQSFTASLWCLLNTDNYRDCVLLAVNLGFDTDTTAAIAGGLAGLYYGYDAIPEDWLKKIARREWIEDLCDEGK